MAIVDAEWRRGDLVANRSTLTSALDGEGRQLHFTPPTRKTRSVDMYAPEESTPFGAILLTGESDCGCEHSQPARRVHVIEDQRS